jgi:uncharacterized phage protein (TIGR01671 family)
LKQYYNSELIGLFYVGVANSISRNPNFEVSDCVFEQYTGLKDKNGNDIYEGDVLSIPIIAFDTEEIVDFIQGPVTFEDGAFKFYGDNLGSATSRDVTIIGNIFENNELLEA